MAGLPEIALQERCLILNWIVNIYQSDTHLVGLSHEYEWADKNRWICMNSMRDNRGMNTIMLSLYTRVLKLYSLIHSGLPRKLTGNDNIILLGRHLKKNCSLKSNLVCNLVDERCSCTLKNSEKHNSHRQLTPWLSLYRVWTKAGSSAVLTTRHSLIEKYHFACSYR